MNTLLIVCILGFTASVQCSRYRRQAPSCLTSANPVATCTAQEILGYLHDSDLSSCDNLNILNSGTESSCDNMLSLIRSTASGDTNPSTCALAATSSEIPVIDNALETGDPEDTEIEEPVNEPHPSPGPVVPEVTRSPEVEENVQQNPSAVECYTRSDGGDYFGEVSETENGIECQSWAVTEPHRPVKKYKGRGTITHPQHFGSHNYCRTLGFTAIRNTAALEEQSSGRSGPWCYTTDPLVRWEYCDVGEEQASCS